MLLKLKTFGFQLQNTKKILRKNHLKKIYKFTSDNFLIEQVLFVLIVRNFIKNEKFQFAPNLCEIRRNVKKQNCLFQKDLQL